MIDISDRIRNKAYISRVTTAKEAAKLIHPDDIVAVSGFTPAGYPKAVPLALAKRIGREHFQITLYAGAMKLMELWHGYMAFPAGFPIIRIKICAAKSMMAVWLMPITTSVYSPSCSRKGS